jgi:hypothetical protein
VIDGLHELLLDQPPITSLKNQKRCLGEIKIQRLTTAPRKVRGIADSGKMGSQSIAQHIKPIAPRMTGFTSSLKAVWHVKQKKPPPPMLRFLRSLLSKACYKAVAAD